jgi:hypothetical protein
MCTALQHLIACIRRLEEEHGVRKCQLMDAIIKDPTVQWDEIFSTLALRGRHRHKLRWRRAVVQENLRRSFPRGGARANSGRRPRAAANTVAATAAATTTTSGSPVVGGRTPAALRTAPWFIDVRELQAFAPLEAWERFRAVFPVLAVYRAGWVASLEVSRSLADLIDAALWEAVWQSGTATVDSIAFTLQWPAAVCDVVGILLPLCRRLWPEEPWTDAWITTEAPDGAARVTRATVPYLRRAACLLHGFHLGGCSPKGVWEAILLPDRA